MKENSEKEEQKEKEDNNYLPLCVCTGMIIGLAIGSSIKKDKKKK